MENTQLDSEVRYSEALHAFKQDTLKYVRTLDTMDSPKESPKTSMLEVRFQDFYYDQLPYLLNAGRSSITFDMIAEYKTGRARRCTIF